MPRASSHPDFNRRSRIFTESTSSPHPVGRRSRVVDYHHRYRFTLTPERVAMYKSVNPGGIPADGSRSALRGTFLPLSLRFLVPGGQGTFPVGCGSFVTPEILHDGFVCARNCPEHVGSGQESQELRTIRGRHLLTRASSRWFSTENDDPRSGRVPFLAEFGACTGQITFMIVVGLFLSPRFSPETG